eukprot:1993238-Prymnesium_polylepis.1
MLDRCTTPTVVAAGRVSVGKEGHHPCSSAASQQAAGRRSHMSRDAGIKGNDQRSNVSGRNDGQRSKASQPF